MEEAGLIADKVIINSKNIASSAGCVSETFTIATAIVSCKKTDQKPISDDGGIVARGWVKRMNREEWGEGLGATGYILTADALASLNYMEK
ncbi:MAG: hypothetical protein MJ231_05795 [bacterium]|nr:hypothetical protein [bacterium]